MWAYLLAVRQATATVEDDKVTTKVLDPTEYDEVVTTKDSEMIDAFLSRIIHARMKTAFTTVRLNVMTQALHADEGPLPQVWQYRMLILRYAMAARMSLS